MINRIEYKIAKHFGLDNQLRQLQEECSELSVAISKYFRYGAEENLIEELADVELVLDQIVELMDVADKIKEVRRFKANRTMMRIEGLND